MNLDNFVKKNRGKVPRKPKKLSHIGNHEYEYWESRKRYKLYLKEVIKEIEKKSNATDLPEALSCLEKVCEARNFARDMFESKFGEVFTPTATTTNIDSSKIIIKDPLLAKRYPLHLERNAESDTSVELSARLPPAEEIVHMQFTRTPLREFVTWNTKILPPETEDEKDLMKKSHELDEKIANDFCQSMVELDPECSSIFTRDRVIDLFDIKFNDAHKQKQADETYESQLFTSELKTKVALEILTEKGKQTKQLFQANKERTSQSNSSKSFEQKYNDLESLKLALGGITNLRIVEDFTNWITTKPDFKLPPYLKSKKYFSRATK